MLFENYFKGQLEHAMNKGGASLEFFYYKPTAFERITLKILHILCLLNILICLFFILVLWRDELFLGLGLLNLVCIFFYTMSIIIFYKETGFKYLKIPLAIAWLLTLSLFSYFVYEFFYIIILLIIKIVEVHF